MRRPVTALATVALTAGLVGASATGAGAVVGDEELMDYPGTSTPPGEVEPTTPATPANPGKPATPQATRTVTTPAATLPFTGGELVLLVTAGAAALGAGGALVVASRRRSSLGG